MTLFGRWLLLVYIPLALLAMGLLLLFLGLVSGAAVWLLVLLAAYCVLPVRLLLERRRRELPLPGPRNLDGPRHYRETVPAPAGWPEEPSPAIGWPREVSPSPITGATRLTASQRAMAGIVAIAVLLFVGGILLVFGMGRLDSSLGLLLAAVGGFLMILSVTVPTFRLFDLLLRAVARLIGRKTGLSARSPQQQTTRRYATERREVPEFDRTDLRPAPPSGERDEYRRLFPPELY